MNAIGTVAQETGCPSRLGPAENVGIVDPAPFVRMSKDGERTLELSVQGAHCGGCIAKIERGLKAIPDISTARLNLSTGRLTVSWHASALQPLQITKTIADLGYRATPFDPQKALQQIDVEGRFLLRCMAVSGFATANIMLLSVAVWAGVGGEMGPATRTMLHWVSAAIALPAVAFAGRPFFRSAVIALRAGHANMDVPISLAVILAVGLSIYETLNSGVDTYFDAAAMLLFFLLIGRYLDHRLRGRARAAAQDLLALQAVTANRLNGDGSVEAVSASMIVPGDQIVLLPGDRAPVNGDVVEGVSDVDISLVTGESAPETFVPGKVIHAGVLNISSRLVVRATNRAEDSLVAELSRLVETGAQGKSQYIRLADRAAALYVPLVHSLALATFFGWYFIADAGLRTAMMNGVAVLIITCPCALGLAAPAVQIVATSRLFKAGVLVKTGDALERLAEIDRIIFDKTGTLTSGKPQLVKTDEITPQKIEQVAMLARGSRHPFARAVVEVAGKGPLANDIHEIAGSGVEGMIDGQTARFGKAEWVGADQLGTTGSEAWFRLGEGPAIRFVFADTIRRDVEQTVTGFKNRGVDSEMLSGDRIEPARQIASTAGIEDWTASMSPTDKIDRLNKLKADGIKSAMVGDGLNDAPCLAAAHASLSPGTAADVSQAAADFVFQSDSLAPVLLAYDVAKLARKRIVENFSFAALYNICAIPLAVFGFVTPLIAAIAMSGSSIIVTLNALRLNQKPASRDQS